MRLDEMGTGETGGYSSVGGSVPQSPTRPQLPPVLYKVGIYGWRKRCLYLLILLLLCTVIINFSLTVWILRVMDFSVNGMGRLRIHSTGLVLEGNAEFLKTVYAADVSSRLGEALSLHSTRDVLIHARNEAGNVTGRLKIGSEDITSHSERFIIYDTKENELLYADEDEIRIGTKEFTFTGSRGVVMEGPLETPEITAAPGESLHLQSLTSSLTAQANENLELSGGSGDLTMSCLGHLKLTATEGKMSLSSQDIRLSGLPRSEAGPLSQDNIYEVCVCQNGRLFLAAPPVSCQSTTLCDRT